MSEKKPIPTSGEQKGKTCPVCGDRSYSREGIHPQCASLQADAPRKAQLAAEKKAKAGASGKKRIPWGSMNQQID
jgi:hypothetical protein